jgi:hypothetical protein
MASLVKVSDEVLGDGTAGRVAPSAVFKSLPASARGFRVQRTTPVISDVLLLAGGVRPKGFRAQLGRSVLDLPVGDERRLMDLWRDEVGRLSEHFDLASRRVRVLIDGISLPPRARLASTGGCDVLIERDSGAYRGTGGVLKDACRGLSGDSYVLVMHAGQLLCEPLAPLVERLMACGADLSFPIEPSGGAGGVFLVRAGCLAALPDVGFVDFKEQAIPVIAKRNKVRVAELASASSLPIRSLQDYIQAVRHWHVRQGGNPGRGVSIVEAGARVCETSRLHDSVVLAGGRVEAGAILAGSLVTPTGIVGQGRRVVHSLVTGAW